MGRDEKNGVTRCWTAITLWTFLLYEVSPDRLCNNGGKQCLGLYLIKLESQSLSYLPYIGEMARRSLCAVFCRAAKEAGS